MDVIINACKRAPSFHGMAVDVDTEHSRIIVNGGYDKKDQK